MLTQIKAKWNNHRTDLIGFTNLEEVKGFDTIDGVGEDKTVYYQILLHMDWYDSFYETSKEDRALLVKKLLEIHNK